MIRSYSSWKSKIQYLNLEYLCLSFNKWPSLQYKFWVSLVLWNHNNGEHCWLGNGPEGRSTLHKEGKSQKVITEGVAVHRVLYQSILNAKLTGRNWAGKGAQATGMTASLRILSSKADSNTWDSFTRCGQWTEAGVSASRVTTSSGKGLPSHFWNRNKCQKRLTWAKEKNNWTAAQWSKVLFSDKSKFGISFGNQGLEYVGRLERHRIQAAWSPVWSFRSQWWFGVPWCLLVLVHCVLSSPKSMQPSTRRF